MKAHLKIASLLLLAALAFSGTAGAQAWPTRPIEWVVPFAAGGSTDVLARLVAEKLKDRLGQPIVIVNRGGANGDIGYRAAAAAAPDGHTIVLTVPSIVTNPFQLKAALEPARLAPVVYLADGPYVLLASHKFPATTILDAIARIRSKPGAVSCGMTGGMGSLACQTLQSFAKGDLLQVPYRGIDPATIAIMAGDIDLVFSFSISATRPLKSGRVRALATTALKRGSLPFPDLPTISEALPGFEISRLERGFGSGRNANGHRRPSQPRNECGARAARDQFAAQTGGLSPVGGSPQDFAERLKIAEAVFGKVLMDAGATPQ